MPQLARQGVEALVIGPSPLVLGARVQLARYAIPAIYPFRDNAEAGGHKQKISTYSVRRRLRFLPQRVQVIWSAVRGENGEYAAFRKELNY